MQTAELIQTSVLYKKVLRLMGNRFEISVMAKEEGSANSSLNAAVEEIERIEALLSTFKESSDTNRINELAGIRAVKIEREVLRLIQRCLKIS
jgi:thiamine biosynthesis lipoprotein